MTSPQVPAPTKSAAKFEMYLGPNSVIYWRFIGPNGKEIAVSQKGTAIKEDVYQGIRNVKENALIEQRYEKTTPMPGKFAFRLRAANHQIVAESVSYDKAEDRDEAMSAMRRASEAAVVGSAI